MPTKEEIRTGAKALHREGRLREAVRLYRFVLKQDPADAEVHFLCGAACQQLGLSDEAIGFLQQAVQLQAGDVDARHHLAIALAHAARLEEAVAHFEEALRLKPGDAAIAADLRLAQGALDNRLGTRLLEEGQPAEAETCFRRALESMPGDGDALCNLGCALARQDRPDEAIDCFRRVVTIDPANAEAHNNLGVALVETGHLDEALACYAAALQLKPDYVDARANRATALLTLDRFDEALAEYDEVLRRKPDHRQAHFNMAFARMEQNQVDQALDCYARLLEQYADDAEAHHHRAMALLASGRFAEGWPEYEWRWKRLGHAERPAPAPRWNGEPLAGRTILLRQEQGQGDCIHFVRYAPMLKQQGAQVVVECEPALAALLERCDGVDQVVRMGESLPALDIYAPLLSVPGLVGTTPDTIPAGVPYLEPSGSLVAEWNEKLAALGGLKVGIAWRGNPANASDRRRSIPLACFAPLADTKGVALVSLQVGPGRDELAAFEGRWPLADLGGLVRDFHDTAAIMRSLDLVITCDSAPAHLAGALGVPVWVALPFAPDWRWMLAPDASPWYPTMRLFRQPAPGDWQPVFRRMADELAKLA